MLSGIASHRGTVKKVSKEVVQHAIDGSGCRCTHVVASVPCLARFDQAPAQGKPSLDASGTGVIYIPANVPLSVVGSPTHVTVRALDADGIVSFAPIASM